MPFRVLPGAVGCRVVPGATGVDTTRKVQTKKEPTGVLIRPKRVVRTSKEHIHNVSDSIESNWTQYDKFEKPRGLSGRHESTTADKKGAKTTLVNRQRK